MVRCRQCNRILKNPDAIEKGIGPVCARKVGAVTVGSKHRNDSDNDEISPYDGGAFWIERLAAETITAPTGQTEMLKHAASGVRTNVPRQIYRHSPAGYNFGYGGSGSSDLALNICLMLVHADDAYQHYMDFKWKFVAPATDADRLEIPRADAEKWFSDLGVKLLSDK